MEMVVRDISTDILIHIFDGVDSLQCINPVTLFGQ